MLLPSAHSVLVDCFALTHDCLMGHTMLLPKSFKPTISTHKRWHIHLQSQRFDFGSQRRTIDQMAGSSGILQPLKKCRLVFEVL